MMHEKNNGTFKYLEVQDLMVTVTIKHGLNFVGDYKTRINMIVGKCET